MLSLGGPGRPLVSLLLLVAPLALGAFTYLYSVQRGQLEERLVELHLGLKSSVVSLHAELSALAEKLEISETLLKKKQQQQLQQSKDRLGQRAELQVLLNETLPQLTQDIESVRGESKSFRIEMTATVNEVDHESSLLKTKLEELRGSMLRNTKAIKAQSKAEAVSEEAWALRNLDIWADLNLEVVHLNESHQHLNESFASLETKLSGLVKRHPEVDAFVNAVDKLAKHFEDKKRKAAELESWLGETEGFMAQINSKIERMQNLTFIQNS